MNKYVSVSIKIESYGKLRKIAKREKRTISDELSIICDNYNEQENSH